MNANYDDPKYTAYVLGELDDAECAAVEAELRDDPQLVAAVAEIRAATERLSQVLQTEHLPKWRAGQLAALLAVADGAAVEGREITSASPSPPAPLPSRERGESVNGEVGRKGDLVESGDQVSVASRPRRLSWRGRLIAVGTLATAVGLMVAVVGPAVSDRLSRQRELALVNTAPLGDHDDSFMLNYQAPDGVSNPMLAEPAKATDGGVSAGTQFAIPADPAGRTPASKDRVHFGVMTKDTNAPAADYTVTKPASESRNNITELYALPEEKQVVPTVNRYAQSESGSISLRRNYVHNGKQGEMKAAHRPNGTVGQVGGGNQSGPTPVPVTTPPAALGYGTNGDASELTRESLKVRTAGGEARGKQDQQQQNGQPRSYRYAETQPNAKQGESVDHLQAGKELEKRKSEEAEVLLRRNVSDLQDLPALGVQGQERDKEVAEGRRQDWGFVNGLNRGLGGKGVGGGGAIDAFGGPLDPKQVWDIDFDHNTEAYDYVNDNPFLGSGENPLSTFSIDVDTASYSNVRRFLMQQHQRPPRGAVRIEEMVNYFRYDYPQPEGDQPFSVTTEVASCPWEPEHRLVRIGLKGREIPQDKRPPSNLVFLIDVSGSMSPENKLPLVKKSLKMLAEQLGENDKVSMVVYAGNSGLVLPSTRGDQREAIIDAIDRLDAGGSTNGAQGIELAYEIATNNLIPGNAVNRVILATDGDFNVGVTSRDELIRLIEEKAKTGVFLTTLGYGMGNIKDSTLEQLADKGNGSYAYIDDLGEARKVLVEEMASTLYPIAKDVKIQVEFNPAEVASYRLIGYENRVLAKEDFNDDKKDAGEIGAGHTVTALYEITPVAKAEGQESGVRGQESVAKPVSGAAIGPPAEAGVEIVDSLKYQEPAKLSEAAKTGDLFTLKLRYKQPDGDKSTLIETPVKDAGKKYREASADFKFAAAVASFGMLLRESPYKGNANIAAIEELAQEGVVKKDDKQQTDASYRAEFVEMVKQAKALGAP